MPKTMACPFFKFYKGQAVHCESGRMAFQSCGDFNGFVDQYCANVNGWSGCTMAAEMCRLCQKTEEEKRHGKERKKKR